MSDDAFDDWMIVVADVLIELAGVVAAGDHPWRDWFDAGVSPTTAARRATVQVEAGPSAMDLWRQGRGPRPGTKPGYWA